MTNNRTTDNNLGNYKVGDGCKQNFSSIANVNLAELVKNNPNLLVFPPKLGQHNDDIEKEVLFSLQENQLQTFNYMGFVGCNDSQLTIASRFYEQEDDFFLHYMLQKVFALNIVDLKVSTDNQSIWDIFLLYLFPHYLQKALHQGLYKEYVRNEYNNVNVKGSIQVARHLRQNMPFVGKIAYQTREHTEDNRMTQLIRHTIEYIKNHALGTSILNNHYQVRQHCNQIIFATPTYNRLSRQLVMSQNQQIIHHPYFTEYEILRRICLQILRKEGITYGKKDNKIYGLLFDGAWLWEEYLNTFLTHLDFTHPKNKESKNKIFLFKDDNSNYRFPDFYKKKDTVLDAKYKRVHNADDLNKLIMYMYVLEAKNGGFIFPTESKQEYYSVGKLNGYGGAITNYPLHIQKTTDWSDFQTKMKIEEAKIIAALKTD